MLNKFKTSIRRFHNNEDGVGAIEKIAMLAVSAIILVGILKFTESHLMVETKRNVDEVMKFEIAPNGGSKTNIQ